VWRRNFNTLASLYSIVLWIRLLSHNIWPTFQQYQNDDQMFSESKCRMVARLFFVHPTIACWMFKILLHVHRHKTKHIVAVQSFFHAMLFRMHQGHELYIVQYRLICKHAVSRMCVRVCSHCAWCRSGVHRMNGLSLQFAFVRCHVQRQNTIMAPAVWSYSCGTYSSCATIMRFQTFVKGTCACHACVLVGIYFFDDTPTWCFFSDGKNNTSCQHKTNKTHNNIHTPYLTDMWFQRDGFHWVLKHDQQQN